MSKNITDASLKKRIVILCIIAALLLVSGICAIFISRELLPQKSGAIAYIYSDGELVKQIDLRGAGDLSFEIKSPTGGTNTVTVKDGDICVSHADCPNGLCVKQGFAKRAGVPIVCLPNKLVIIVKNKTGKEADYDAVTY